MKKRFSLVVFLVLLLSLTLAGCGSGGDDNRASEQGSEEKVVRLGIIQIREHPALDAARRGFLEAMKAGGYEEGRNLEVDFQNAQGDQSTLQNIARKFAQDKKDLILAIATDSAMAMANETQDIPILITAVTDPVAAKLVKSLDKPGTNVTGTTDMNPIKEQLELLKQLVPAAERVGVIYNSSEVNSQVQVAIAKEEAGALGLTIVEAPVTSTTEVVQATQSLVGRVEAIYVPTDNTVVSAISGVLQVAEEHKIPVLAGESNTVEAGALATIGIDYYKLGQQTGEMALRVLKGEKPQDMPIERQRDLSIVVNAKAAEAFGVTIPEDLKAKADKIIE
ncbi:MAG: ABC transporter substrate-binding protein [Thermoanaerobacteraceae bacterium]|uniref:ABC transporter substrate-binding protein n=1 Tax=Thermanaeromonas sp. C210 TaxID=2731925 RepID=UPI00155C184D|nr:ABC transporter substrate-binding protein [Thermanaeromonas sp. C210]MBE3580827.1 ABC transporter substrate-binding protein [Thermoanaerobacteraceae bacterium]GFN22060.1 ABC transporter substrate-binding protein [Thermanaeromonas sp. C210]